MASISRDRRSVRAARSGAWRRATAAPGAVAGVFNHAARPEIVRIQLANHRFGGLPHVESRVERASHAFDHHHGLLQQHQFRPCLHIEQFGHLEQQRQQLRHGNGLGRLAMDRLADGADRLGESCNIVHAWHIAGLEMHLGYPGIVAGDEAEQDFGQEPPLLLAEPPEMPRSTATMVPSASTNRLPGCMSAWKKPSRSVWRRKTVPDWRDSGRS